MLEKQWAAVASRQQCQPKYMGKKRIIESTPTLLEKEVGIPTAKRVGKEQEKVVNTAKKGLKVAKVYIQATYNNTVITLTDTLGNVLGWSSAGAAGFKGTKKSTPFAASKVAEMISEKILKLGIENLSIFVKGVGSGRDSAIRSLASRGLNIVQIKDITPLPHGGVRPPKIRRV